MSSLKIRHFGPIKEGFKENDGWLSVKKTNIFIGNQGSGKSTLAKVISTLTWLEKSLVQKKITIDETKEINFLKELFEYQNLRSYFKNETEISYKGDVYTFNYSKNNFSLIEENIDVIYSIPKVMYIPAERNFVAAVSEPSKLEYLPKPLFTFLEEYERSKKELNSSISIPINDLKYSYQKESGKSMIIGEGFELNLYEASSGFQSVIPLYLVSKNLAEGIERKENKSFSAISLKEKDTIDSEMMKILNRELANFTKKNPYKNIDKDEYFKNIINYLNQSTDFNRQITILNVQYNSFINIVEEPEQNLFPNSQWEILKKLVEFNNLKEANKLVLTTHSPYLLNDITLLVKGYQLQKKMNGNLELEKELNSKISLNSTINPDELAIYELDETDGSISLLEDYKGLPSDENYLNDSLGYFNELYAELLDLEDKI
ncbi:ATP-binding protein [Aureivirga sp. CE67]|uniref:ATP-binding protein n=1 Tax=Aureivirga sp. CE67 TaxID=1788983 RepID=UPI0018C995A7|nr:ATP-binding protein [Aureivirga sp. CE67]